MVLRYYHWLSRFITTAQRKYPWLLGAPNYAGGPGWLVVTILLTAPVWAVGVVIYLLPLPFDVRFDLWILLLVAVVVWAIRTALIGARKNKR